MVRHGLGPSVPRTLPEGRDTHSKAKPSVFTPVTGFPRIASDVNESRFQDKPLGK